LRLRREDVERSRDAAEHVTAELAEANEQLVAMDEAKNRFLSVVSHDLRTPITSIKAFGEILEEETEDEHKGFARTIVHEADRLRRLVTDLLDLDKMEAGKMDWNLSRQDIRPVLENSLQVFRAAADEKSVTLAAAIAEDLPDIDADSDRLSQLVANLLSNAIKFTPEGGTVTISAGLRSLSPIEGEGGASGEPTLPLTPSREGRGDSHLTIAVTDTGPGIPPGDLDTLFDRFSQTAAGKQEGGGTGLGLAIAREIAHGHGGDIHVTSDLGHGTTFSVTLPLP